MNPEEIEKEDYQYSNINTSTTSQEIIINYDAIDLTENNDIPADLETPKYSLAKAVKKSSIDPNIFEFVTKPVKKSVEERSEIPSRISKDPVKYQKLENNEKFQKIPKKSDSYLDKVSSLATMRERFCTKKITQKPELQQLILDNKNLNDCVYKFKPEIQTCTNIYDEGNLKHLEYKLKDFLRKNSKSKVNSYEFTNNSDLIAGFGCSEIKYNEITSVVKAHSINCDNF